MLIILFCIMLIILAYRGDFNAKVGKGSKDENVGAYRLGQRNERENRLVEWAKEHGMIIGNTIFCQPPR